MMPSRFERHPARVLALTVREQQSGTSVPSALIEVALGDFPVVGEKLAWFVKVFDRCGSATAKIPVRGPITGALLRRRIRRKAKSMSDEEVNQWHAAGRWAELA